MKKIVELSVTVDVFVSVDESGTEEAVKKAKERMADVLDDRCIETKTVEVLGVRDA